MAPSPWRRHRIPRHARLRAPRLPRPCPWCVNDALSNTVATAGQLLVAQQPAHWQPVLLTACLLLLNSAARPCPHLDTVTATQPALHGRSADR